MSQRWLKFLKKFGTRGRAQPGLAEEDLLNSISNPKMFGNYEVLFQLYGPLTGSPWVPYHCPTLFAAIDKLRIVPKERLMSKFYERQFAPEAWGWLGADTMVIVDLPGATTIEAGVILIKEAAQPICTFDHWPFATGNRSAARVVDPEPIIDMMFTLAHEVLEARKTLTTHVAPVWLCDNRRLGGRGQIRPLPGTFDNRYFIDDSILAGPKTLRKGGIRKVVYFNERLEDDPLPDLVPFLIEAHKLGLTLQQVSLTDENTWVEPSPMEVPFMRKLPIQGFRRTDMGGFGQMIPVPSEGSYSSGGGGG